MHVPKQLNAIFRHLITAALWYQIDKTRPPDQSYKPLFDMRRIDQIPRDNDHNDPDTRHSLDECFRRRHRGQTQATSTMTR